MSNGYFYISGIILNPLIHHFELLVVLNYVPTLNEYDVWKSQYE